MPENILPFIIVVTIVVAGLSYIGQKERAAQRSSGINGDSVPTNKLSVGDGFRFGFGFGAGMFLWGVAITTVSFIIVGLILKSHLNAFASQVPKAFGL